MSREYGLTEYIQDGVDYFLSQMNTALPGVVVTVRQSLHEMTVDVQPMVSFVTEDGEAVDRPVVLNVPIHFPTSRKSGMSFPVEPGDPVLLVYSMRNTDTWKRGQGTSSAIPTDKRKFDRRDCFAIPGFFPMAEAPNAPPKHTHPHDSKDTVLYSNLGDGNEVEVRLKPDGNLIINAPVKVTVNTVDAVVNADNSVEVNTNTAVVNADTSADINTATATINAPNTYVTGNLFVTGLISGANGLAILPGVNGSVVTGDLIMQSGDIEMRNGDLDVQSGDVTFAGGVLTHNGKNVGDTHKHTGVQTGGDVTGNPQ